MPGTYSQILLHVVFSTKERRPLIDTGLAPRLYAYIGGIIRAEKGVMYEIGGIADHVHLYLRWRTDESIAGLMRTVKSRSSKWVHEEIGLREFAWQEGYSVFSVSKSQEEHVKRYILGQREHHAKEDFKSELLRLLRAHEVEFDERYVFE
ncbi:MAG: IS200/IS605 family transposase [Phycisphaeraceae bacterium]|nr:IS200/IS605 family transposase [Phycisphaeraceae bacterium]MBX3368090.1 IS200/IS605 family transposase [Phycisphaeraceae bacterium]